MAPLQLTGETMNLELDFKFSEQNPNIEKYSQCPIEFRTDTLILLETEIPSQFLEDSEDLGNDDFRAEIHLGTVYPYVEHINSDTENFKLDLPAYLQHALICYVKARIAEDAGNLEYKEYMMREYKKHIETYESSLVKGPRMISSGHHAIR